ncbi:MAG TPA: DUF4468 domain-containing protein [Bacteroidales bacterium]|nr:DUF4468 domain-containing protein [Bacteroidales bacterium]HOH23143.1 DUF4468 domain-containing protein [Bacteroidales bacterium]HPZ04174.1 DUF4468 domain-containing protein [Bacteroidales bacterium]HQB75836.1 DUF4468 domain-containing protein [Bacteroidales bacterium]
MKKAFLLLLISLFSISVFAQKEGTYSVPDLPIDEDTKLVTYRDVVREKGTPQELYDRAMDWIKAYYKNTNEVIKSSDRDKGVIEMRSSVRIHVITKDGTKVFKNIVYYNFRLECRQDRYRYTITDFNEKAAAAAPIEWWFDQTHSRWQPTLFDNLNEIHEQIQSLLISLEEGMAPKVEKVDDW